MATSPNIMTSNNPAVLDGGQFGTIVQGNGVTIDGGSVGTNLLSPIYIDGVPAGGGGPGGTVEVVTVAASDGIIASVANDPNVDPEITLSLGNITPNAISIQSTTDNFKAPFEFPNATFSNCTAFQSNLPDASTNIAIVPSGVDAGAFLSLHLSNSQTDKPRFVINMSGTGNDGLEMGLQRTGTVAATGIVFRNATQNNSPTIFQQNVQGTISLGSGVFSSSNNTGCVAIPGASGVPTGTPSRTNLSGSSSPLYVDTNTGILYVWNISGSSWTAQNLLSATSAPATASSTGVAGSIARDNDYIYVCVATDTWKRSALTTW